MIVINESPTGGLVLGSPYLAAYLRQHRHFYLVVFENYRLPFLRHGSRSRSVKTEIRVQRRIGSCDRVGIRKAVCGKFQFRYLGLGKSALVSADIAAKCHQKQTNDRFAFH